jgi:outer membrane receptor protein involved in Fe transport
MDPLRLSAQVRHHGSYFSDDTETVAVRVGSATLVDARAAWTSGKLTFFGYVRNLFDTFRLRSLFNPTLATPYEPREAGIGIETRL